MIKRSWVQQIGWMIAVFAIAVVLWRLWIPNLTSFEAPGWDESDRSKDALIVFRALTHFNPLPFLNQLVLFQTWGPLFAIGAQLPLMLFGPSAQSLTFVSFSGLIFGSLGYFISLKRGLGLAGAVAVCLFAFAWLTSAPGFSPYFLIMMLEAWVIAGWLGIALSGPLEDPALLIAGSWILFAAKYQYYPVFFIAFLLHLMINRRRNLISFAREFIQPTYTKILVGLAAVVCAHIAIMKVAGPIYGQPSWNGPRALRNPVLGVVIVFAILVWCRREAIYNSLVDQAWEEKFIKFFFFPATVLVAFPWPNRWAGVMVTQSYQSESHTPFDALAIYGREVTASLQSPTITAIVLFAVIAGAIWSARKTKADFKSQSSFVVLIFLIQTLVLLTAVKNLQPRFAYAVFLTVPVALFATFVRRLPKTVNIACAVLIAGVLFASFRPAFFFLGHLHESPHTNSTYFDYTELFPLDRSLGPIVRKASQTTSGRPVRFAIVSKDTQWSWDRPMQLWPIEFELHEQIASEPMIFVKGTDVCAQAKAEQIDVIVEPTPDHWEIVSCP